MSAVLVTGGAGYIGSHTCKQLAQAGHIPVTYDNLCRGHRDLVKWGPLEVGEVGDTDRLIEVIGRHNIEAVMHFAAFAYIQESMDEPRRYLDNNVTSSFSLLEACRQTGIRSLVVSSTCAVYGQPKVLPITEATIPAPINIYGMSKLMLEQAVRGYSSCYGLNVISLRYFNACGADPDMETGEDHDPEPHLIPRALLAAAGVIPHLDILGTQFDTRDGTCIRDFIHVCDLARTHVAALERLRKNQDRNGIHETYNLGSTNGYSVKEIAEAAGRVVGTQPRLNLCPPRLGDPAALVADSTLARKELGFELAYSDLDEILQTAWDWMRKRRIVPQ